MSVKNRTPRFTIRSHSSSTKKDSKFALAAAIGAVGLQLFPLLSGRAQAATFTWDPGLTPTTPSGGTGTWDLNTTANWSNATTDNVWTDSSVAGTDIAIFGGTTAGTVTLNSNLSALGINLNTTGYIFNGTSALTLGANGINETGSPSNSTDTIGIALNLGASQTWSTSTGSLLSVTGNIANNGFTLSTAGPGTQAISGVISGAGGINQNSSGTLLLTAANLFTGGTVVTHGVLDLNFGAAGAPTSNIINNSTNSSALTLNSNGNLSLFGGASANSQQFNGLTLGSGSTTINMTSAGSDLLLSLGAITRGTSAGIVNINLPTGTQTATNGVTTTTANTDFTAQGGSNTILGGDIVVNGNTWGVSASNGVTAGNISGLSTFSTSFASAANVDAQIGNTTVSAITVNSLRFNNAGVYNLNAGGNLTIASGGVLDTAGVGANAVTINNNITSATGELIIDQYNTAALMNLAGIVSGTTLTKAGPGVLALTNGGNTYGTTTVQGGTLQIGIGGTTGSLGTGAVTVNSGGVLAFNRSDSALSISSIISGSGGILQIGSGSTALAAADTFTGGVTVNAGTLNLNFAAGGAPTTNIVAATNALNLGGGTLLMTGAASAANSQTFASTTFNTGTDGLNMTQGAGGTTTLNLGTLTRNAGAVAVFNPASGGTIAETGQTTGTLLGGNTSPYGVFINPNGTLDIAAVNATNNIVAGQSVLTYTANPSGATGAGVSGTVAYIFNNTAGVGVRNSTGTQSYGAILANTPLAAGWAIQIPSGRFDRIGEILMVPSLGTSNLSFNGGGTILGNTGDFVLANYDPSAEMLNAGDTLGVQTTGSTGNVVVVGNSTVNITGGAAAGNTYVGQTYLNGGVLEVNNNNQLGPIATGNAINLNGGTLATAATLSLDNAGVNARPINVGASGGGLAAVTGTTLTVPGTISGTGPLNLGLAQLPGTGAGTANATAVTAVGTIVLSGASSAFSGAVNLNLGTLRVDSATSSTGSGIVNVNNGATLMGIGTIAGTVVDNSGGHIDPGDATLASLTVGGLTLNNTSVLDFDFASGNHSDLISVTNANGLTINPTAGINVFASGTVNAFGTPGTYDIFSINGGNTANLGNLHVLNPSPNTNYTFGTSGNFVTLTITSTAVNASWNNTGAGNWSLGSNWTGGVAPHQQGDTANFGANPPGITANSNITLDTSETVGTVNFASSFSYNIVQGSTSVLTMDNGLANPAAINDNQGTHTVGVPLTLNSNLNVAALSASDTLVISGTLSDTAGSPKALMVNPSGAQGTVILTANNTGYFGAPTINGGTLQVGAGGITGSLGNYAGSITDNGTLAFDLSSSVALSNTIVGSGTLEQSGSGILTVNSAANAFANTNITNGKLQLGSVTALGNSAVNINAPGTLDVNGLSPTILALSGNGTLDNAGSATTSTVSIGTAASVNNNTFAGSIKSTVGTLALIKNGSGTLFLNGSSTYSGGTTISAGFVKAGNNTAFGTGSIFANVGNGLQLANGINVGNAVAINAGANEFEDVPDANASATLSGAITSTNSGMRMGTSQTNSTLTLANGTLNTGTGIDIITRGNVIIAGTEVVTDPGTTNPLVIGRFNSTSSLNMTVQDNAVINATDGVQLGGLNSTSDDPNINLTLAGNAQINTGTGFFNLNNDDVAGAINLVAGGTSNITTNGFIAPSISGSVTAAFFTGGTITAAGNDPAGSQFLPNLSANVLMVVAAGGLTVNNNAHNITIAASLADNGTGAADTVTFVGGGTTTITNNNTWAGDTNVGDGTHATTLVLGNPLGTSALGGGTTHVNNNAILTGNGQTFFTVAANSGGHIDPGASGTVGTLTFGGLTLNSGSILDFDFGSGINDRINLTSANSLSIASSSGINLFNAGSNSAFSTSGTYDLFDVAGGTTATLGNLSVLDPAASTTYNFSAVSDGAGGSFVQLVINSSLNNSQWNNAGSGAWGTAANWTAGIPHLAGDTATFGSNPPGLAAAGTVSLGQTWTVGSIAFNNTNSYTLGTPTDVGSLVLNSGSASPATITDTLGSHTFATGVSLTSNASITVNNAADVLLFKGSLSGSGGVSMSGSGTAILANNNNYAGLTTVDSGTLQIGNGGTTGTLGTNAGGITDNGTLAFNTSSNLSVANAITGSGAINQSGSGTSALSGANSIGAVNVSNGILQVGNATGIGSTANVTTTGGKLDLNGNSVTVNSLAGTGGSIDNNAGFTGANTLTINGSLATSYGGSIANTGGTLSIVKTGAGTQTLTGNNTYTGTTTINSGILVAGSNTALGNGGTITDSAVQGLQLANGISISNPLDVADAANEFLDVPTGSATLSGPISISGTGAQFRLGTTSGTIVLTGATNTAAGITLITRGNVVLAGSGSLTSTTSVEVGRFSSTASANMTIQDNATVNVVGFTLGGLGGTSDDLNTNVTLLGNGSINTGTGALNLDASTIAANTTTLTLGGTSNITAANVISTTAAAGAVSNMIFNGGTLTASASDPAGSSFLPVITTATVSVGASGGKINNGGFSITLAQPIVSGGGTDGGLAFSGAGTTTITAANTYNGGTTLSGGTLVLKNSTGSALGSGNLTLNGGVLANSASLGSLTGNVLAGTGAHTIAPGGVGTIGSMTLPSLTSSSLTTLNFDLGTGSSVVTNGDLLTLNAATIGAGTIISVAGSPVLGTDYRLIGGTAVAGINLANFVVPTGDTLSKTVDPGFIDIVINSVGPASLTWNNASGNNLWDTNASVNWNAGASNSVFHAADNVTFNDNNPGPGGTPANYAVTLNSTVNPGSIIVNNSNGNYSISGTGSIAGTASLTKSGTGTLTLSTANTFNGGVNVSAGTLLINRINATSVALPKGALNISGTGLVQLATNVTLGSQTANPPVNGPASNLHLTSIAISGTGQFDINNNHLIVDYTPGNDPIASISAMIINGYAGGTWNGSGIVSSAARVNSLSYGIGYADAADPGNPAGLAVGQIEIEYTLLGDANLDGKVNGTDFAILATNFNQAVGGWDQGDFNYDKKANGSDFAFIGTNFNQGASQAADESALTSFAAANGLLANVPEPASTGLLALGAVSVLGRRRRKMQA